MLSLISLKGAPGQKLIKNTLQMMNFYTFSRVPHYYKVVMHLILIEHA